MKADHGEGDKVSIKSMKDQERGVLKKQNIMKSFGNHG